MRFAVLYGSTRRDRVGIRAARFLANQMRARGHDADIVDPVELDLPLLDLMHKQYGEDTEHGPAPAGMQRGHEILDAADGYIVVGGEWNHSIPPALKNLLDHYQSEFFYKPAGIASYSPGPFGGARAAPHYRVILGELGMVTTSILFSISGVHKAFDDDGNDATEKKDYERRAERFLNELEWYTAALKRARAEHPNPMQRCGDRAAESSD